MRKRMVYLSCALWLLVLGQFTIRQFQRDEYAVVQAMENIPFIDTETCVELSGRYSQDLNIGQRERLLMKLGEALGVHTDYHIVTEGKSNGSITTFQKNGENGQVVLKFLTIDNKITQENYIVMRADIYDTVGYALDYREKMQQLSKQYQIDGTVCIELTGTYHRPLSMDEKKQAEQKLFHELEAEEVTGIRDKDLYTIYGYTKLVDSYLITNDMPMNVNIAFTQNEAGNTVCHMGVPVIWEEY